MSKTPVEAEMMMMSRRARARQQAIDALNLDLPSWLSGLFVGVAVLVPILGTQIVLAPRLASNLLIALTVIVVLIGIDGMLLRRKVAALILLQQQSDEGTAQAPSHEQGTGLQRATLD